MATNPNVLIDRDKYIGGSEIAAILGISKFKTRWELLQEKVGITISEFTGNIYTEYGDKMESKIRDYINTLGISKTPFVEDTIAISGKVIGKRCNYDGLSKTHSLEIKTTSDVHERSCDYKYYVVQLLWGMILGKRKTGILAVYHRPDDFNEEFDEKRLQIFKIKIGDYKEWEKEIEIEVDRFIQDLEKLKENPFLQEQDLLPQDIQSRINALVAMEEQVAFAKRVQEKYEEEKEKLLQEMIKSNMDTFQTPNGTKITWVKGVPDREVEEEYYDENKFALENAELWNQYHDILENYKGIKKVVKKGRKDSLRITIPKK